MLIDAHTHVPSPNDADFNKKTIKTVGEAVAYMQVAGIDAALTHPWRGVFAKSEEDIDAANRASLDFYREFDGFLYPGCSIHPAFPRASTEWLSRYRDKGFLWVGELVPAVGESDRHYRFSDPEYMTLFEECARHGHILQLHNCSEVLDVVRAFPEMQIVQSHILLDTLDALAACPNAWLDISGQAGGLCIGALEAAHRVMGAERLLFGSDFTGYEPRCFVARVETVVRDASERRMIYSGNVMRLLALTGSRPIDEKGN